jgi:hypothetical protein
VPFSRTVSRNRTPPDFFHPPNLTIPLANYFLSFKEIRQLLDPGRLPWDTKSALLATAVTQATAETFRVFNEAVRTSLRGVMQVKDSPGASAN